jgi:Cu/Ag efflux pump CusA
MAIAIIGGIIVSTMLSLVVVPAFFVVADRMKTRLGEMMSRRRSFDKEAEA